MSAEVIAVAFGPIVMSAEVEMTGKQWMKIKKL